MTNNAVGIQKYGESVSDLVQKAQVDDEALFKAVVVDRSTLAHPNVAKRISIAQLKNDTPFMDKLSKAVTQTKPGRKVDLDNFRYIVEVLDEIGALSSMTVQDITQLLVNELGVYPDRPSGDAEEAIKKQLQIRKKRKGK